MLDLKLFTQTLLPYPLAFFACDELEIPRFAKAEKDGTPLNVS